MKKLFLFSIMALAVVMCWQSCSKDDDEKTENTDTGFFKSSYTIKDAEVASFCYPKATFTYTSGSVTKTVEQDMTQGNLDVKDIPLPAAIHYTITLEKKADFDETKLYSFQSEHNYTYGSANSGVIKKITEILTCGDGKSIHMDDLMKKTAVDMTFTMYKGGGIQN